MADDDECGRCQYLEGQVDFWKDQQRFAASAVATIADLDEEAPALRQMLRTERDRRHAVEKELLRFQLAEQEGRLLPSGGEVRDQFTVLEIDPKQRNGGMVIHWSLERAEEGKTRFKDDPGGYEGWPYRPGPFGIYRRQMRTWGDGSEHYTPWSPVVPDGEVAND